MGNQSSRIKSVIRSNKVTERTVMNSQLMKKMSADLSKNNNSSLIELRTANKFLYELFKELGFPLSKTEIIEICQGCTVDDQFSFIEFKALLRDTLPAYRLSTSLLLSSSDVDSEEVFEFTFSESNSYSTSEEDTNEEDTTEDDSESESESEENFIPSNFIDCASFHSMSVDVDKNIYILGASSFEEMNSKTCPSRIATINAIRVKGISSVVLVSCGNTFTVCIDSMRNAWSFGSNEKGQLGLGDEVFRDSPHQILNLPPASFVCCGSTHTIIIDENESLWAFGNNDSGQLGLGNQNQIENYPQLIQSHTSIYASCGKDFTIILESPEKILSCGNNIYGQLGLGDRTNRSFFVPLTCVPENIESFSCGNNHTIFKGESGELYGTGSNKFGQLGFEETNSEYSLLTLLSFLPKIKEISCKDNRTMCIDKEGFLWGFGSNTQGELGCNPCDLLLPQQIEKLKKVNKLTLGTHHTIVQTDEEISFGFGLNSHGQLGLPFSGIVSPTQINQLNTPPVKKRSLGKSIRQ